MAKSKAVKPRIKIEMGSLSHYTIDVFLGPPFFRKGLCTKFTSVIIVGL